MNMSITNAEWKIMEILWTQEPRTITELTKELKESTNWPKQAIITMLNRMMEKGTVRCVEGGKAKLFFSAVTRAEAEETEANQVMEKAFSGSASLMISAMVRQQKIKEKELFEICEMLGLEKRKEEGK